MIILIALTSKYINTDSVCANDNGNCNLIKIVMMTVMMIVMMIVIMIVIMIVMMIVMMIMMMIMVILIVMMIMMIMIMIVIMIVIIVSDNDSIKVIIVMYDRGTHFFYKYD